MRKASRKAKRVEALSENVYGERERRLPVRKRGGGSQWMWAAVPINLQMKIHNEAVVNPAGVCGSDRKVKMEMPFMRRKERKYEQ